MAAVQRAETAASCQYAACSDCSHYYEDVEMPARKPGALAVERFFAASQKSRDDDHDVSRNMRQDASSCNAFGRTSGLRKQSTSSNIPKSSTMAYETQEDMKTPFYTKKPFYMYLPFVRMIANWFDDMWYAESVFVCQGEQGSGLGTSKRSARPKVVIERSSRTQGSFWSTAAGSDKTERLEVTRNQRANIQLLPLRFKDEQDEEEFTFNNSRLMAWRNMCLCTFKIIATSCVYIIVATSGLLGEAAFVPKAFINYLHVVYGILLLLTAFSLFLPLIPCLKDRLEYSIYGVIILEALVIAAFMTYTKSRAYSNQKNAFNAPVWNFIAEHPSLHVVKIYSTPPPLLVYILSMELLMDSWVQFFMYFSIISISMVLPTRVRIAVFVQITILFVYSFPILTGQHYCGLLLYPELLRLLQAVVLLSATIAGTYASETKRRGFFYSWLTMKRQMKLLESERDKSRDDGIRSGISNLQGHCKQVEVALMSAKTATSGTDISCFVNDAAVHIAACLEIMANSKDLYHTELHEELRDKSFIRALNVKEINREHLLAANRRSPARAQSQATDDLNAPSVTAAQTEGGIQGIRFPCFLSDVASRVGVDVTFNPLAFHRKVQANDANSSAFFECGYSLLWRYAADWGCEDKVLRTFLIEIEGLYNDLPYHNSIHGATVAHLVGVFCRATRLNTQINSLGAGAIIVAALCHDVGHPGRNNAFFSASRSSLAVLYNDSSVLENFHSALTFSVLSHSFCNIFESLAQAEVKEIRSHMISLILATDMKTHFSALSRFRAARQNPSFDHRKQLDDTWLVVEMCMRAADIGHSIVPWDQHYEWSSRVTAEFYLQGDEEARLGKSISPLCDRDLHRSMAHNQVGFLAHIVKPLFTEINSIEIMKGAFQGAVDTIEANANRWQQLQDSGIEVKFSPVVVAIEETLRGKNHVMNLNLLTDTCCRCPCCKSGNAACHHLNMKVRINDEAE